MKLKSGGEVPRDPQLVGELQETVQPLKVGKKPSKISAEQVEPGPVRITSKVSLSAPLSGQALASQLGARGVPDPKRGSELGVEAGGWAKVGARIISSNDVEDALRTGDFSKFPIKPDPELLPLYRSLSAALGAHGINGPNGNGGRLGPNGDDPWNPSELMRAIGDWSETAHKLNKQGGPGSKVGIFGDESPLGDRYKLFGDAQTAPGGLLDDVGPLSRAGALGDTGPLSGVGVHGFGQDLHGNFVSGRGIERTVELETPAGPKRFDLVENYDAETARKMKDNDASWKIRGGLKPSDSRGHTFTFNVKKGQLVKLQASSESLKDSFQIELLRAGKVIAKADSRTILASLRFQAESDGKLQVRIKRMNVPPIQPTLTDLYVQSVTAPVVLGFGMLKPFLEASGMKFKPHPEGAVYRLFCTGSNVDLPAHQIAAEKFAGN